MTRRHDPVWLRLRPQAFHFNYPLSHVKVVGVNPLSDAVIAMYDDPMLEARHMIESHTYRGKPIPTREVRWGKP